MNPLLDQLLTGLLIAGALAFFALRARRRRGGKACGSDCCGTSKPNPTPHK